MSGPAACVTVLLLKTWFMFSVFSSLTSLAGGDAATQTGSAGLRTFCPLERNWAQTEDRNMFVSWRRSMKTSSETDLRHH